MVPKDKASMSEVHALLQDSEVWITLAQGSRSRAMGSQTISIMAFGT